MITIKNKRIYDWNDIEVCVDDLCRQIKNSDKAKNLTTVTGIPRGGVIPALMISHTLGLRYLPEVRAELDDELLLIDDISDSGKTLAMWVDDLRFNKALTATIHWRVTSAFKPDFDALWIHDDKWMVYPWEDRGEG